MCIACVEFIKSKLNVKEFKSALQEVSREDHEHLAQVEQALNSGTPDDRRDENEVRRKITELKKTYLSPSEIEASPM